MVMGLFGCGKPKYKVDLSSGFTSKKSSYAEGENVTAYFDMIATDTNYNFYLDCEDVELKEDYDNNHGYVFTFIMPAHDVKLCVSSYNSMVAYPPEYEGDEMPEEPEDEINPDNMVFDYYEKTEDEESGSRWELVLYTRDSSDDLILARYSKNGSNPETVETRIVPKEVLDACMELTDKYQMAGWNAEDSLEGKTVVVKFLNGNEMLRISSEEMPENGMEAFDAISAKLAEAWNNGEVQ